MKVQRLCVLLLVSVLCMTMVSGVECDNGEDDDGDGLYDVYGACEVLGVITSCTDLGYNNVTECSTNCFEGYLPYDSGCSSEYDETEDLIELEVEEISIDEDGSLIIDTSIDNVLILGGDVSGFVGVLTSGTESDDFGSNYTSDGDSVEDSPNCDNGEDDDGDGLIDYPEDLGCEDEYDNSELNFISLGRYLRFAPEENVPAPWWAWVLGSVAVLFSLWYLLLRRK